MYSDFNIFTNTANATKRLTVESAGTSGTPSITLKSSSTSQGSISLSSTIMTVASETSGVPINFTVNNGGTTITPLSIYSNGVVRVANPATVKNKMLVLSDNNAGEDPALARNFYGWGLSSNTLQYQTTTTSGTHKFYSGNTLSYTITQTGGANGSDARWKTEVENITNALDKISQLQGKTFILNDSPTRQMGFIAQEVKLVCPEVIVIDENSDDHWHFMQYDKLTALLCEGIKEQQVLITSLTSRVASLEARLTALEGNPP
jgi:hypothetical protein